jgi:general secretion pathway protein G
MTQYLPLAFENSCQNWWSEARHETDSMVATLYSLGPIVDLKITQAQQDLNALGTALDIYKVRRGVLPSEQEGLGALVGVSLAHVTADPWGSPYVYRRTDRPEGYRIYSRGRDERDDDGGGDDITTTPKKYRCADYGVNCPPTPRDLVVWSSTLLAASSLLVGLVQVGSVLWRWCSVLYSSRE